MEKVAFMPFSALLTLGHRTFHICSRPPISESYPRIFFCSIRLCQVIISSVVQLLVRGLFLLFFVCAMRGFDLFSRTLTCMVASSIPRALKVSTADHSSSLFLCQSLLMLSWTETLRPRCRVVGSLCFHCFIISSLTCLVPLWRQFVAEFPFLRCKLASNTVDSGGCSSWKGPRPYLAFGRRTRNGHLHKTCIEVPFISRGCGVLIKTGLV